MQRADERVPATEVSFDEAVIAPERVARFRPASEIARVTVDPNTSGDARSFEATVTVPRLGLEVIHGRSVQRCARFGCRMWHQAGTALLIDRYDGGGHPRTRDNACGGRGSDPGRAVCSIVEQAAGEQCRADGSADEEKHGNHAHQLQHRPSIRAE
jgi:hypothetical protein